MSNNARKVIIKESTGRRIIEQSRIRLLCIGLFFLLCFTSISVRMMEIVLVHGPKAATVTVSDADEEQSEEVTISSTEPVLQRGDIVDRNGALLATSLMTASLFANPSEIKDLSDATTRLSRILGLDAKALRAKLDSGKTFVWIKRNLTNI